MAIKIGITGTRSGMTEHQFSQLRAFLSQYPAGTEFHHGDCVGVDVEAATLAETLGFHVVSHPGPGGHLQAGHKSHEVRESQTHFKRNRNIVDSTEVLVVIPFQAEWQPNGGTWYTHDYAVKKEKPVIIMFPVKEEK